MNRYKIKPGWKHLAGAVFERDGNRLHLIGLLKIANSTTYHFSMWPYSSQLSKMERIKGGNRKRACMALADYLIEVNTPCK
jgi:hypothetical protein